MNRKGYLASGYGLLYFSNVIIILARQKEEREK